MEYLSIKIDLRALNAFCTERIHALHCSIHPKTQTDYIGRSFQSEFIAFFIWRQAVALLQVCLLTEQMQLPHLDRWTSKLHKSSNWKKFEWKRIETVACRLFHLNAARFHRSAAKRALLENVLSLALSHVLATTTVITKHIGWIGNVQLIENSVHVA